MENDEHEKESVADSETGDANSPATPVSSDAPPADPDRKTAVLSEPGPNPPNEIEGRVPTQSTDNSSRAPTLIVSALLFLALLGVVVSFPIQIYGDGSGYLGMAASLIKDHNLAFDEQDIYYTARWGDPETLLPFSEKGFLTKLNREDVRIWGTHSFYYPLLLAPFLMLFGVKGAVLLNILLIVATFAILALALTKVYSPPNQATAIGVALALLLCTPLLSYVFWVHTEISLLFAVFASIFALHRDRPVLGALLLGWAAAQKPPLVAVFGLFVLWLFVRNRQYRKIAFAALAMVLAMAPQIVYNLWSLGTLTSFGGYVDYALISQERVFTFWLGPARGMIWFFPLLCWCIVRSTKPWWWTLACIGVALVVSAGSCVITVFYGHEVGLRYAVYIYPLFLTLTPVWKYKWIDIGALGLALFLAGGLLLNPLGNLATWQVYPNPYPSRLLAGVGVPLYPETFQRTGLRMPREIVADFVDTDYRMRKESVEIMARRLRDPEMVVKLYCDPGSTLPEGAAASLWVAGEEVATSALQQGRITTLCAEIAPEMMDATTLPGVAPLDGGEAAGVSILRSTLKAPRYNAARGKGRLWWTGLSRPDDPMAESYVYQAGPKIVGIYPGGSWLVETMASDELESVGLARNLFNNLAPSNPAGRAQIVEGANVEGATSIRLSVEKGSDEKPVNFVTQAVDIEMGPAFERKLEILGWFRCEGLKSWTLMMLFEGAREGKNIVSVARQGISEDWQLFRNVVGVPPGSNKVSLFVSLEGTDGSIDLDDVVVGKWWDPWH